MGNFMKSSIEIFKEFKAKEKGYEQICFIISDGRLNKDVRTNLNSNKHTTVLLVEARHHLASLAGSLKKNAL